MTNPEQEFKRGYGNFDPSGIEEYDLAVLRPLAKETERLLKNAK